MSAFKYKVRQFERGRACQHSNTRLGSLREVAHVGIQIQG